MKHPELNSQWAWARRLLGPASLGPDQRYAHALSVDVESGLLLIGAPGALTAHGAQSGAALRSWALQTINFPLEPSLDSAAAAMAIRKTADEEAAIEAARIAAGLPKPIYIRPAPPMAPPPATPLMDLRERVLWGNDADPNDHFGTSVALGPVGHAICGSPDHGKNVSGDAMVLRGAVYAIDPVLTSPSLPPASPPEPPGGLINSSLPWPPSVPPPALPPQVFSLINGMSDTTFMILAGSIAAVIIVGVVGYVARHLIFLLVLRKKPPSVLPNPPRAVGWSVQKARRLANPKRTRSITKTIAAWRQKFEAEEGSLWKLPPEPPPPARLALATPSDRQSVGRIEWGGKGSLLRLASGLSGARGLARRAGVALVAQRATGSANGTKQPAAVPGQQKPPTTSRVGERIQVEDLSNSKESDRPKPPPAAQEAAPATSGSATRPMLLLSPSIAMPTRPPPPGATPPGAPPFQPSRARNLALQQQIARRQEEMRQAVAALEARIQNESKSLERIEQDNMEFFATRTRMRKAKNAACATRAMGKGAQVMRAMRAEMEAEEEAAKQAANAAQASPSEWTAVTPLADHVPPEKWLQQ